MVFKKFLDKIEKRRESASFQRQLKAQEKLDRLESRAARFESEAEIQGKIGKKKAMLKRAKQQIFEQTTAFKTIEGIRKAKKSFDDKAKRGVADAFGGFGPAQTDIFGMGGSQGPRRKKKGRGGSSGIQMESQLGTDSFF